MKHRDKVKLARRLRSRQEIKYHIPIFQTREWESRRDAIAKKVERRQNKKQDG